MQRSPLIFSGLLALSSLAHGVHAAELGDAAIRTWLGQPMIVDIELLPDEGGQVQAFLAHADVFRGANVAVPPVLASAHFSVMRRDGRQFLHVTSIKPVETAPVHLFLELVENGKHSVREVTLWFKPDPHPPALAAVANPATAATTGAPAASGAARTAAPHGQEGAASAPLAASGVAMAAVPASDRTPAQRSPAARGPAAKTAPAADARACAALDYQNAQLSAQIVDLEEKVKLLQAAIGAQAAPAPKPLQLHPAAKRASAKPGAKAAKDAAAAAPKTNWLLYGGIAGALAGVGGAAAVILRKRKGKAKPKAAASGQGALATLLAKLKHKKAAPPASEPAQEPSMEPETVET